MFRFKIGAKKKSFLAENSHVTKIWKTTFPKEIYNRIGLKVGEDEYIYFFWNKSSIKVKMAQAISFFH